MVRLASPFFLIALLPVFLGVFLFPVFSSRAAVGDPYIEWAKTFHAGETADDTAYGIATFRSGTLQEIWNRLNTSVESEDAPTVTVDPAFGSVYAATYFSNGVNNDYRVIKFNSAGQVVTSGWPQTFNSTANLNDFSGGITADSSGNIYVTGRSDYGNSGGGWNFVTLKYSPSGVSLWNTTAGVGVFDAGNDDRASGVALDSAGNVYVGGIVSKSGGAADTYTVIKYNSQGTQIGRCNLAALNNSDGIADTGKTVVVDSAGNIYFLFLHYNGATFDYGIVKFNSSCTAVTGWNPKIYAGGGFEFASGLAVDSSENVYVTGYQSNGVNYDYQTVKFNSSAVLQWRKVINYGGGDSAFDLVLDEAGANVYVSGYSWNGVSNQFLTVQYDVSDTRSGDQTVAPPLLSLIYDTAGNDRAYSIARSGENFFVAGRYDSSPTNQDIRVIKYGPSDDVYVVGTTQSSTIAGQIAKYDSLGNFQWAKQFSPAGVNGEARDIAVDSQGKFYVTGYTVNASNNKDFRTIKYDSGGNAVAGWDKVFNGSANQDDIAYGVALDSLGDVYVTGASWDGADWDFVTIKYASSSALELWNTRFPTAGNTDDDVGRDIAIASSGDVYATGYSGTPPASFDFRTIKYSSSTGSILRSSLSGNVNDERAYGVAVSAEGYVYATGDVNTSTGGVNLGNLIVKHDSQLGVLTNDSWNYNFTNTSNDEGAFGIVVDAAGDPYITGVYRPLPSLPADFKTIKYASSTGSTLWSRIFNYGSEEGARAMTIDSAGNFYLAGSVNPLPANGTEDFLTLKYGKFALAGPACAGPVSVEWTDPTIVASQTRVKKVHVNELRAWVNNQRQDVGLGIQAWTDSTITANSTKVKAAHFTEMRNAINAVYTQCGQALPTYTDPTLTANSTKIKKAHIEELRSAVSNAP